MFKEKVNALTDGRTDGRTTDNRPWHKLAGLRPVELINLSLSVLASGTFPKKTQEEVCVTLCVSNGSPTKYHVEIVRIQG